MTRLCTFTFCIDGYPTTLCASRVTFTGEYNGKRATVTLVAIDATHYSVYGPFSKGRVAHKDEWPIDKILKDHGFASVYVVGTIDTADGTIYTYQHGADL